MPEDESAASWNESRRLIVSQLRGMEEALRDLTVRIDLQGEKNRDRISVMEQQTAASLSDLKVRIAMLEVRAKIWGGMVGLVGGAVGTFVVDVLVGKLGGK